MVAVIAVLRPSLFAASLSPNRHDAVPRNTLANVDELLEFEVQQQMKMSICAGSVRFAP